MGFKFNASEANTGNFELLPEGKYEVHITDFKKQKSATKGTEWLNFTFTLREDYPPQAKYKGRKVWGSLFFTENTTGQVMNFLKNINTPDGRDFLEDDYITEIGEYALGAPMEVEVYVDEYNGKERNQVRWMNASRLDSNRINVDKPAAGGTANNDPFANNGTAIDISDDDLPF